MGKIATCFAVGFIVLLAFCLITVGGDLPMMKDGLSLVEVTQPD